MLLNIHKNSNIINKNDNFAKKCMTINSYSRQDTAVIKGFAILCICLHNLLHWIHPFTGENEFSFSRSCVNNFFDGIVETPAEFFNILFTFLGHYGVQIFIFISGFGLTISMMKCHKSWLNFVVDRLKKIYPLLLTAIIFYNLFFVLMYGKLFNHYEFRDMIYKLLLVHTLLPGQALSLNGPWWFFALIFQLYLIFPLLFSLIKRYNIKAFIVICLFSYTWIFVSQYLFQDVNDVYLLQIFPAHLPEFCFGMLIAFNKDKKINNLFFFIALIVFCLGNYFKIFFPFTFLSFTIMTVFIYDFLKNIKIKKRMLRNFLVYFGDISMALFAVHGFLRKPFVTLSQNSLSSFWWTFIVTILFLMTSVIVALAANQVYDVLLSFFNKKNNKQT